MEFGRLSEPELDAIDWSLPADPAFNQKILSGKKVEHPRIFMGCAKWGIAEWVGKLYPPKTKEKNFLANYILHYNSIEYNATHYKIFGPLNNRKKAEQTKGKDFLFCPKMFQGVTHRGSLKGKNFVLNEFLRGIRAFDKNLGPVFIQLSDSFSPKRSTELFEFLEALPKDLLFFLEVRHAGWFAKETVRENFFSTLCELGIGAVITDSAGRRDCVHMHLTQAKTFIRFIGNSLHHSDYSRIDDWVLRIKQWVDQGLEEVYFFMHMHDEVFSPELTVYLARQLNAVCGAGLQVPELMGGGQEMTS